MEKLDLVKDNKTYYKAKSTPEVHEFGLISYVAIVGIGAPAGQQFTESVEALYPLAYGIKNIYKKQGMDFGVSKLEGLWWVESEHNWLQALLLVSKLEGLWWVESDKSALEVDRNKWQWKLLIRMPDYVSQENFMIAKNEVYKKKKWN